MRWSPPPFRPRARVALWAPSSLSSIAVTSSGLALSPFIIASYGWPTLFVIFGALGAPLLAAWYAVMPSHGGTVDASSAQSGGAASAAEPDAAAPQPRGPAAEPTGAEQGKGPTIVGGKQFADLSASSAAPTSVGTFLRHRATIAIVVANFVNHWGYFIFLSWIPAYFAKVFQLDLKSSALMSFAPWVAMAVGSSFAGLLADSLVEALPRAHPCYTGMLSASALAESPGSQSYEHQLERRLAARHSKAVQD